MLFPPCSIGLSPREIHRLAAFDIDVFRGHHELIREAAAEKTWFCVFLSSSAHLFI